MTLASSTQSNSWPRLPGYVIAQKLYEGSRTAVYRAFEELGQRQVIIKLLKQDYPSFNDLLQFRNQYAIAKNLPIPGIVHPYSLEPYGNSYALVMEDFGGVSLERYGQTHPLCLREVLKIALQLSQTLHDLHQAYVIHKDIKPANILIHPASLQVRLIDFSIASLLPKETPEIKNPAGLEGTLAYLAPEQTGRMNRGIDYRADFYAFGVTLFELLTGQLPFQASDPMELMHCHLAKQPPKVQSLCPEIPAVLSEIVATLMAKNAEDRYQSALGLQHDLQLCLTQLEETGEIAPFKVRQRDLGDRFLIPEKLYGRESEVKTILEAFARVSQGTSELLLVAGFSGIGKTAVVNEVHKPIVRQRGYFIKGKFDQFNRNIPLSAFVQAFRDLMGQLLSESDAQLQTWKLSILDALGDNAQVIVDVIPELERIIDPQPPAPELLGTAAQSRFNLLFQKFTQVFTTPEHPLVMFLDDLQWADSASLKLMQLLIGESQIGYLLLIGAYRDNEVFAAHPLMLALDSIKKARTAINTITLQPLSQKSLNHLVADTLNCDQTLAQNLTELVYQRTQGNPFFATQFLKALHQDKLITFDAQVGHWQCDITQIRNAALTDDVVNFMVRQLQKLPTNTQEVLKLAACIGNQFDLRSLAVVAECTEAEAADILWRALQEGLVIPQSEVYKFYAGGEQQNSSLARSNPVTYRFLHDRVQQAAYSLIPETKKQHTHLKIGQRLLQNTLEAERSDRIFAIVNQLNIGANLIEVPSEQIQLAQLNLLAGRKAKESTAYSAAFNYLSTGISLLGQSQWQTEYPLALALHQLAAEVTFLKTDFTQMELLAETVLEQAKDLLESIRIYELKVQAYQANNQLEQAVKLALEVLQKLGVQLPQQPDSSDIQLASEKLQLALADQSIENLADLPWMTNPEALAAMRLLSCASSSAYIAVPQLLPLIVFKEIELSIAYGNAPASAFAYADYGMSLCAVMGDIETGYQFGNLALKLLEKSPDPSYRASTLAVVNGSIRHWQDSLESTLSPLIEAYTNGLETGDVEFAALAAHMYCYHSYLAGRELPYVDQDMKVYTEAIGQLQQKTILYCNQIYWQTVLNLMGQGEDPRCLVGTTYDERDMLPLHLEGNNHTLLFYVYFNKAVLLYLFQDYAQALEQITEARQFLQGVASRPLTPLFYVYESLILLAIYPEDEAGQKDRFDRVLANREKIQQYAQYASTTYLHKLNLVEAEQARVVGSKSEAIDLYDRAIAIARESGFLQEEALANELAARFYLDWGKDSIATSYMQEAYYCYARWGAKAKTDDLEQRYAWLLRPILQTLTQPLTVLETMSAIAMPQGSMQASNNANPSSSANINTLFDFATILKASQSLSETIQLDELLHQLTQIILQHSGADRCTLIQPNAAGAWQVEAIGTPETTKLCSDLLDDKVNLPIKLIQYVKNTQEVVMIDDLKTNLPVLDDYLLWEQPKSVLCLPVLNQGQLIGILALENKSTSGVFTRDRILILNFLCTQAAISLENARLYQQAQTYAHELEQSQLQIVQSEKMASLGNLVAGVAHEINNPIGFLNGSINNAKDYVKDLLDHLALYQQHYPDPVATIAENAEDIDLEFLSEDLPKLLASMRGATDRIKSISTSLRTFSRADTEYKVSANLHEGIDSTLLILKYRIKASEHRPAIQIIQDYGDLPPIECFPGQLNQVFMNILSNAIDMFDEMTATQSCQEIEAHPQTIKIRTAMLEDRVQISIGDNGRGMTEEVKARIFDHLFTTKGVGKGTGLGLTIARQIIVEKHGGSLTVQSELGQGTEFLIQLPFSE